MTDIPLKEFIDEKFKALEKATDLASRNLAQRLDSLNEWRLQNKDERDRYITRAELWAFVSTSMFLTISIITLILKFFR